jgi:hypothetical protein
MSDQSELMLGRVRSQVGYRIHMFASYRDLIGLTFAEVSKLKGIVNMLQVHVFLHCLREVLALMGSWATLPALTAS